MLVEGIFYGGVCYARSLQESDSAIGFPHALRLIDRESAGFLVNHEIKHALSDDGLMIGIASAVGGVVRTVLSGIGFYKAMSAFSFSWGGAIAVVSSLSGVFFARRICKEIIADLNRWRERKADDFAIAHASDEELKGGWRHFTVAKRVADDVDKGMCTRLPWYGTATMLVHMVCGPFETHPTLESRIRKIEKALVHRGIVLDEATEARRLEILRIYRMASLRLWHDMGKESVPEIRETRSDVYNSMIPEDLRGTHRKDSTPEEKGRAFWHCVAGLCKEDVTKDLRRTPFPEAYRTSS
ncbi:MAG: M48 family metalloprotease [Simkaniaceae bacterium]|nr:M48 family metalloprotease [Simkaniaceae bacterium]